MTINLWFGDHGTSFVCETVAADAAGNFRIGGLWAGDKYEVRVSAADYEMRGTQAIEGTVGGTIDFGKIALRSIGGVVAGKVVDSSGKPLADVRVFNCGDAPAPLETRSDDAGKFRLAGLRKGTVYVSAEKDGYRFSGVRTSCSATDAVVTMLRSDQPPPKWSAPPPPANEAEQRQIAARKVLELLATAKDQYIKERARAQLTALDAGQKAKSERPPAAKSSPPAPPKKNDIYSVAEEDVDEALSMVPQDQNQAYQQLKSLAEHFAGSDREKALRFVAEATVRARNLDDPRRVLTLAELGALASRLGNNQGGAKLAREAADMAGKWVLTEQREWQLASLAKTIAPVDLASALDLAKKIRKERRSSCLADVAMALDDVTKAESVLKEVDGWNAGRARGRLAFRIAAAQPAEAIRLVENIPSDYGREELTKAAAFGWLATAIAPKDPKLAHRLIDRAFAIRLHLSDPTQYLAGERGGAAGTAGRPGQDDRLSRHAERDLPRDGHPAYGEEHVEPRGRARIQRGDGPLPGTGRPTAGQGDIAGGRTRQRRARRGLLRHRGSRLAESVGLGRSGVYGGTGRAATGRRQGRKREAIAVVRRPGSDRIVERQPQRPAEASFAGLSQRLFPVRKVSDMGAAFLLAALCMAVDAPATPAAFDFKDATTHGGRSVQHYRAVEFRNVPVRPLKTEHKFPAGTLYGVVRVGPNFDTALTIVWAAKAPGAAELWLDANGDGRLADDERHAMSGRQMEIPATFTAQLGPKPRKVARTLLFRRSSLGDGLRYSVRGYMQGRLDLGGTKYATLLVDGNANGCFDTVGQDRVWIDLNRDGCFDPLVEQFPLGKIITRGSDVYVVRSDATASAVVARLRSAGQGKLRLVLAKKPPAAAKVTAELISDLGELVVIDKLDEATAVPFGDYRLSSLKLEAADSTGQLWTYNFDSRTNRNYSVPTGHETTVTLLREVAMKVSLRSGGQRVGAGETVAIQPELIADGSLYLSRCTVGKDADRQQAEGNAEILLLGPDGKVVSRGLTGFS